MRERRGALKLITSAGALLTFLVNYCVFHFQNEEEYFNTYNYPHKKSHMRQHSQLVKQVQHFFSLYQSNNVEIDNELFDFLKMWLTQHITKEDKQYTEFFNKLGVC
jgi:hemerythrin-like metal-binding protein